MRHADVLHDHKAFNTTAPNGSKVTEEEVTINKQRLLWLGILLMIAFSITLLVIPKAVKRSFAVETYRVGVYSDFLCTQAVTNINWGQFTPGESKTVRVYIRNEELSPSAYIAFTTQNWDPTAADHYISLTWNYIGKPIPKDQYNAITLTLKVASNVASIYDFNFDILIVGAEKPVGDVNGNGKIDLYDIVLVAKAYLTTALDSNWRPDADLNGDGIIDEADCHFFHSTYRLL